MLLLSLQSLHQLRPLGLFLLPGGEIWCLSTAGLKSRFSRSTASNSGGPAKQEVKSASLPSACRLSTCVPSLSEWHSDRASFLAQTRLRKAGVRCQCRHWDWSFRVQSYRPSCLGKLRRHRLLVMGFPFEPGYRYAAESNSKCQSHVAKAFRLASLTVPRCRPRCAQNAFLGICQASKQLS